MNKIKKLSLTIGIPAHNEEKNIESLIRSILNQNCNLFDIREIIVACDGCTDRTAEIVKDISRKYSYIKVISDDKRLGKNGRLNNFYRSLDTDIFLSFDADIKIIDKNLINKITNAFSDTEIGLVGGKVLPVRQMNIVGKVVAIYEEFWSRVIESINNGNNVHSHTGPISAARREFLKNIVIPQGLPDDHYLYFRAFKEGYKYKFVRDARVYIKVPATIDDYLRQSTRFLCSGDNIRSHFGKWTGEHYYIPYQKKIRAYILTYIKHPILLPMSLALVFIQKIMSYRYIENDKNGFWKQIASSK